MDKFVIIKNNNKVIPTQLNQLKIVVETESLFKDSKATKIKVIKMILVIDKH
jgi:hypothetical protein